MEQIRHPWLGKMILIKQLKIIACLCGLFHPTLIALQKCQMLYTFNWYFSWCFAPEHKIMEQYKGELYITENILILWKILPIRRGLPLCKYVCSNNLHWAYVYSSRKHGTGTEILQKLGTYFNHLFYSDYLRSSIQFYRIWRI